jgi:hypothetical protein
MVSPLSSLQEVGRRLALLPRLALRIPVLRELCAQLGLGSANFWDAKLTGVWSLSGQKTPSFGVTVVGWLWEGWDWGTNAGGGAPVWRGGKGGAGGPPGPPGSMPTPGGGNGGGPPGMNGGRPGKGGGLRSA